MAASELRFAAAAQHHERAILHISSLEKGRNSKFSWVWSVFVILACEAEAGGSQFPGQSALPSDTLP